MVVGPLAFRAQPGAHDLCDEHAARLTAPVGWQLIRLDAGEQPPPRTRDDLLAIADAVREPDRTPDPPGRKHGHLRVIGGKE